jgi:crotonobetainyl-CoA:carnitine CoA-transferase CaiB-like acyl-CoA transferase
MSARGPLSGVRALVLTHAWAGTFCTEQLALAGADVIQVEARRRPDGWRMGSQGERPAALQALPSAQHPWNCSGFYHSANLNKQGITLDLQLPEGLALFKRMLPAADVVAENFSPRVMHNLGLDYEALRAIRGDIILCSLSAYGATGPYRDYIGNGGTLEPTSGMASLLGYADGPPMNSGNMYPDPVAGSYGFAAIVTALFHRFRTGRGQYIDLSMQEANHTFTGDAALEYTLTGHVRERLGNRSLSFAPHAMYPAAGKQQWLAIAAESEEQWQALCHVAGADWAEDPRFATNAGRRSHEAALNSLLAAWTAGQQRDALAARLQAAGVPAAPVLDALEVAHDPGYDERGFVVDVTHPEAGTWRQAAIPYRLERTPLSVTRPSPMLGEHSAEVLQRLLGVKQDEYERLVTLGVTGTGPPD